MLSEGTRVDPSLRLPRVPQCTLSKTGLTGSISHTSALCLQNRSFCPMTFMFGLPLQLRGSMLYHLVCSVSITSCYLLQYSPPLVTILSMWNSVLNPCLPAALVSLRLTVPELFLCIVSFLVSLFIYHQFAFWLWFLLNSPVCSSEHIARGWQTALIFFYKLQSMQWNSEVWLWPSETGLLPQSLILM